MTLTFAPSELKETVKLLEKIKKTKETPYIRIKSTEEGFVFGVSNGMVTMERFVPGDIKGEEDVDFLVNRDVFIGLVKKARGKVITLTKREKTILFTWGEMKVALPYSTEPIKYVEMWEGENSVDLNTESLLKGLNKVAYAAEFGEYNLHFAGVLWDFGPEKLRFVGTDSFRLAYSEIDNNTRLTNVRFLFPIFPLEVLESVIKETEVDVVKFCFGNNKLYFEIEELSFCVLLRSTRIIEYEGIVFGESNPVCEVELDRGELIYNLNMAEVLSMSSVEGEKAITIEIKDKVRTAVDTVNGTFDNYIEAEITGEYKNDSIGFFPSNILDVLKRADTNKIKMSLENETKAMILQEDGEVYWKAFVMPVRTRKAMV